MLIHEDLGAPTRYRVQHLIEQAQYAGFAARALRIHSARPADVRGTDLVLLHRLRFTRQTLPLILAARRQRVPVVFESDDLVWDPRQRQYEQFDAHYPPQVVRHLMAEIRRTRWLMAFADAFIFSTPYLAVHAALRFRQSAFVHPNVLSEEQVRLSELAASSRRPDPSAVRIAYFSGTRCVHDEDLASVGAALRATLDACPQARLLLVGEVALPAPLAAPAYAGRIERRPPVPWQELPTLIATTDINLAPLLDNPQRRAKSAVKYLEAAAVGVPTLASRLDPYEETMIDGTNGLLAHGTYAWVEQLARLVHDPDLRREIGATARRAVLAEHTTIARAPAFGRLIRQILGLQAL